MTSRSNPTTRRILFTAAAVLLVAVAAAGATVAYWLLFPDGPTSAGSGSPAGSPEQPVSVRYIDTSLIVIEATDVDLNAFVPETSRRSGAVEVIGDRILVADADGRFYQVEDAGDGAMHTTRLPTRIDLNAAEMLAQLKRKMPKASLNPVRLSDLHYAPASRTVYVTHSYWNLERQCGTLRVLSMPANLLQDKEQDQSAHWTRIYESATCLPLHRKGHESGGRMWIGPDDTAYVTIGHYGRTDDSQDDGIDVGKIIRLDLETGKARHFTKGHRNPQGLTMDRNGVLWSTEHGPRGGDELNVIVEGKNYGWPHVSLGTDYGSKDLGFSTNQGRHEGYEKPVYAWTPSIGVSNLVSLRDFHERWNGDLIVTSLTGNAMHRLRLNGTSVILDETIMVDRRIRDIVEADGNRIFLWTDEAHLLQLKAIEPDITFLEMVNKLRPEIRDVLLECASCHQFEDRDSTGGKISLANVYKRRIAIGPDELYSPAFLSRRGTKFWWDKWKLDKFLESPSELIPGTTMKFGGIEDWHTRQEIIAFLIATDNLWDRTSPQIPATRNKN